MRTVMWEGEWIEKCSQGFWEKDVGVYQRVGAKVLQLDNAELLNAFLYHVQL